METFDLPVNYKGEDRDFKLQFLQFGYGHKIQVDVDGVQVLFEPDEERIYRCVIDPEAQGAGKIDNELLEAIAKVIELI